MANEMDGLAESVRRMADRLNALSDAVTRSDWNAFSMRVPAEPDRDADLVLAKAATELLRLAQREKELERENAALREGREQARNDRVDEVCRRVDAEAELAAIKKRIADRMPRTVNNDGWVFADFDLIGKRVALLPLDDEAKS